MTKNLDDFREDLGQIESSGRYNVENPFGFIGKYQMGEYAMIDTGYYKKDGKKNNDWTGQFTGKDGIYSKQDFLNNPQAQENALNIYKKIQWQYLKPYHKYIGQTINGIRITPSGMLAGAHNGGHGAVIIYINSNGTKDPTDGNGIHVSRYMKKFENYDVSEWTGEKFNNKTTKIPEPITEVNEIIKKNHESKLLPKNHKPMFTQPQKQTTFLDLYKDAQNVLTNTVLFPMYYPKAGLTFEDNIKHNLPKVLKTVSKFNKIPVNNIMNIINNRINSHFEKWNQNNSNSLNSPIGFNNIGNNNNFINPINYNLGSYNQTPIFNNTPLDMNEYAVPYTKSNYPTKPNSQPLDYTGLLDLANVMTDIYRNKRERQKNTPQPIPQPVSQPTIQPMPQPTQGYEFYPY